MKFLCKFFYHLLASFALLIFSIEHLQSAQLSNDDAMTVKLSTENQLEPIYLLPLQASESNFPSSYTEQLEKVLAFDFNHNGATFVAERNKQANARGQDDSFENRTLVKEWLNDGISYLLKGKITGDILNVQALDVTREKISQSASYKLTGNLSQDRREIHKLSDSIFKVLFGQEGIARTKILYINKTNQSSDSSKWTSCIWESDYDGENKRCLIEEGCLVVNPVYIPPKTGYLSGAILYVSYKTGEPKIMMSGTKNGQGKMLISLRGNQLMPAVSRQRDKIAFVSDTRMNPDLFIQSFNPETGPVGKPQQIFSALKAAQASPTFNPDGTQIAFVSNKDGTPKIYIMNIPEPGSSLKTIQPKMLTRKNRENTAPAWSPDGEKIAYCARSGGDRQIWIYDFKTGQEKQLTFGKGNKENPSWARNSLHLIYNTADSDNNDLYIVNLNQPEPTKITSGKGDKKFPNWEP